MIGVTGGSIVDNGNKSVRAGRDIRGRGVEFDNGVSMDDTRLWMQVVSSDCIVLQNRMDVELPGVGFNGSITGVGVRFPGVIVLAVCLAMLMLPVHGQLT